MLEDHKRLWEILMSKKFYVILHPQQNITAEKLQLKTAFKFTAAYLLLKTLNHCRQWVIQY
jgi:hypothetical protein